jgi:hypothetical protein
MIVNKLENFVRGWFIGNFEPTLLKTDAFEIGVQNYTKDFIGQKHYQIKSVEYNIVLQGKVLVNNKILKKNDIFIFNPLEVTDFKSLTKSTILSIKIPSIPNDKVNV